MTLAKEVIYDESKNPVEVPWISFRVPSCLNQPHGMPRGKKKSLKWFEAFRILAKAMRKMCKFIWKYKTI